LLHLQDVSETELKDAAVPPKKVAHSFDSELSFFCKPKHSSASSSSSSLSSSATPNSKNQTKKQEKQMVKQIHKTVKANSTSSSKAAASSPVLTSATLFQLLLEATSGAASRGSSCASSLAASPAIATASSPAVMTLPANALMELPPQFDCQKCKFRGKSQESLDDHLRSKPKNHGAQCARCSERFNDADQLKRHADVCPDSSSKNTGKKGGGKRNQNKKK
jgi:hypothetical protein